MVNLIKKESYFGPDGFPLAVVIQDPQFLCPAHRHQFYEIAIVLGGTACHVVGKTRYSISERDVFAILDNTWHAFEEMNHLAIANVLFDPTVLLEDKNIHALPGFHSLFERPEKRHSGFHNRLKLSKEAFASLKQQLYELKDELDNRKEGYEVMAKSIFIKMVVFLSRCYSDPSMRTSGALHRIADIIKYIEENYREPINLDELMEISHMSRRNLCRLFREALDQSPIDYLIRTRIAHAMELLKEDVMNVTQIAFEVGFQDSNYFSRQFRRITGLTPKEYQKHNIKSA